MLLCILWTPIQLAQGARPSLGCLLLTLGLESFALLVSQGPSRPRRGLGGSVVGAAKCAGVLDFLPRHHVKVISESYWKWLICSSGLSLFLAESMLTCQYWYSVCWTSYVTGQPDSSGLQVFRHPLCLPPTSMLRTTAIYPSGPRTGPGGKMTWLKLCCVSDAAIPLK